MGMQTPEVFSLGGIVFQAVNFEVPEDLEIGSTTLGGVEDIPQTDGKPAFRLPQTHGVVCDPIKFDAWFIGDNAESNAEALEAMQKAQASVVFARGVRSYDVVIFRIQLKYRSALEIAYSIELEPIAAANSAGAKQSTTSATSTVSDDTTAINQILSQTPDDARLYDATSQCSAAITLLQGIGPINTASVASINNVIVAIVAAIDLLQVLLGQLAGSTAAADISTYLYAAQLLGAMGSLNYTVGTFVGANGAKFVSPNGMNAYDLVTKYTGNIENVDTFMAVNNLTDPLSLGTAPLIMPGL